jgi:hypothetical protein
MVSKLTLYNMALGHLGPERLAALTEERPDRYELDAVYDGVKQHMLEAGIWKFALRTIQWDADTDMEPLFGLPYAFSMPDDFVRFHLLSPDERQEREDESFAVENDVLYSDYATLYVTYVSNDSSYGGDLGRYPQFFAEAFAAEFAYQSGLPITKSGATKNDLASTKRLLLIEAKRKDALDERVKYKPTGTWAQSRFRSGTRDQRRQST